jgi:hypothetical protein
MPTGEASEIVSASAVVVKVLGLFLPLLRSSKKENENLF